MELSVHSPFNSSTISSNNGFFKFPFRCQLQRISSPLSTKCTSQISIPRLQYFVNKNKNVSIPVSNVSKPEVRNEARVSSQRAKKSADSVLLSLKEKPDRIMRTEEDTDKEEDYGNDDFSYGPDHRSGYVAVIGKPNVGKSTLINQMIGQKLSIVTDKPQTTRHRILGLCSAPDYQMILYDTPGVVQKKMHKLDSMMMKNVYSATRNAECVMIVVDACKVPEKIDDLLGGNNSDVKEKPPTLLVLNKKDLIKPGEIAKKEEWYKKFSGADHILPISAKYGHGVEDAKNWIVSKLPHGPPYYPKDIISEHPERFFVAEIVREKIFMQYRQEIPYACQEGRALKILATAARLDIEDFLQKKVYLEVNVDVKSNWRQDEDLLERFGYGGNIRVL